MRIEQYEGLNDELRDMIAMVAVSKWAKELAPEKYNEEIGVPNIMETFEMVPILARTLMASGVIGEETTAAALIDMVKELRDKVLGNQKGEKYGK